MRCEKCGASVDSESTVCPVCGNIFPAGAASEEIQNEIGSKIDRILGNNDIKGMDDGVDMIGGHLDAAPQSKLSDTQEFKVPDTVFDQTSEAERTASKKLSAVRAKEMKEQYHWDSKKDWEDIDDEAMLEKLMGKGSEEKSEPVKSPQKSKQKTQSAGTEGKARTQNSGKKARVENVSGSFASQDLKDTSYRTSKKETTDNSSKRNNTNKRKPRIREAKKAPGRSHAGLIIGIIAAALVIAAIGVILYTGIYKNWMFWETAESERSTEEDALTSNITEGGLYALPLQITLESAVGNRIYYTLDGSEPANDSLKYNGPISITADYVTWTEAPYTLKAVTYTETSIRAAELTINFTVRKPDIEPPVFSLPAGTYDSAQGITISAEKGATIYYTYDEWGSLPTTESAVYKGTIEMQGGTKILSAIAVNGDRISEVAQVYYTLELAINFSYADAYNKIASKVQGEGYTVAETEPTTTTTEATTAPPETTKKADEPTKEGETTTEPTTAAPTTTAPTEAPKITTAVLFNSGTVSIGGANYYCIWVQLYYNNGERADGMYYGVDSSSGAIVRMVNNGGEFSIY